MKVSGTARLDKRGVMHLKLSGVKGKEQSKLFIGSFFPIPSEDGAKDWKQTNIIIDFPRRSLP